MRAIGLICVVSLFGLPGTPVRANAEAAPSQRNGFEEQNSAAGGIASIPGSIHRVLFLGDSITYAGDYICDIEAYFLTRHPGQQIEFLNMGLPSETVSGLSEPGHAGGAFPRPDLHERLGRLLAQVKPDLVFACYGMNDGIYMPFDAGGRFQKYQAGIDSVDNQIRESGARVIWVTPPTFDGKVANNMAYQDTLDRYAGWLLSRRQSGWQVVDLHNPMNAFLFESRARDPSFRYASDGIHPNALGHWIMAKQILLYLGGRDIANAQSSDDMMAGHPNGRKILELVGQRESILRDAWMTRVGYKRPGLPTGLPLDQAEARAAEIGRQLTSLLQ